jgi:hypothetical protein
MATKPADVQKNLEAILGEKLPQGAVQRIKLMQAVASSTISDGFTTLRNILILRPNQCYQSRLLDVSGIANTGTDGTARFRLTAFLCQGGPFAPPINVVATPLSLTPCFLTLNHTLVNNGDDVEIQVFTWNADGAPAPLVSFDWRCRVELPQIVV